MALGNTHHGVARVGEILGAARRIWFIGIGGVHMSALAMELSGRFTVEGSDTVRSERTTQLRAAGIGVYIGHFPQLVQGSDAVIYTLAVPADDPEYLHAIACGIPVISRAELLGFLMLSYRNRIGVAGSHGKSTVTAMLAEIFSRAGRAPTVFCGAPLPSVGSSYLKGDGEDILFEACEYQESFLSFSPTLAIILNAELDHTDFFRDEAALFRAFGAFGALPKKEGMLLFCADDIGAATVARESPARKLSFGFDARADYRMENGGIGVSTAFSVREPSGDVTELLLRVPGRHNIYNAAAAFVGARLLHISAEVARNALCGFLGAARRMEYKGAYFGARFYDDYAHHPTEIRAALSTARLLKGDAGRLFAVFQSHTYSRTAAFFEEFCTALRLADRVIVADIYPAREIDAMGMSGEGLARGVGSNAVYGGDLATITAILQKELSPNDLVVVMGAGDIGRIFGEFGKKDFTSGEE